MFFSQPLTVRFLYKHAGEQFGKIILNPESVFSFAAVFNPAAITAYRNNFVLLSF